MKKIHKEKGFTLIELLVVIAIIAILSTVVMAGLNSARQKGRDAARLSNIKQVQSALELFFDSCGGYPGNASGALAQGTASGGPGLGVAEAVGCTGVTFGTYMSQIPANPAPGGIPYTYCGSNGAVGSCAAALRTAYEIRFQLEGTAGTLPGGTPLVAKPSGICVDSAATC